MACNRTQQLIYKEQRAKPKPQQSKQKNNLQNWVNQQECRLYAQSAQDAVYFRVPSPQSSFASCSSSPSQCFYFFPATSWGLSGQALHTLKWIQALHIHIKICALLSAAGSSLELATISTHNAAAFPASLPVPPKEASRKWPYLHSAAWSSFNWF